ncbi:MAG TPA: 30S ribosomal protein S4 [Thermodesulfobacteriota bacterium]|nr:MAG: 30S ribosomal protein S4 [Candidatus Dadabacteria bacterium]HKQ32599.1 30S ribosomal protein S4 [Thermodesulfobacteriota bacterium]
MGRYTGPTDRLSRREGVNLFLKGERSYNGKTAVEKRPDQVPGEHGKFRGKFSEFGLRLREKQKVKRMYGIREKQFRGYFEKASHIKGVTGAILISMLERRLDNVVYRLCFGSSRNDARQLVGHAHVMVNGQVVNIPSYQVKEGDKIEIREKSKKLQRINQALEFNSRRGVPDWLELDEENYRGTVLRVPARDDVTFPIEEQLIVEFYSRV